MLLSPGFVENFGELLEQKLVLVGAGVANDANHQVLQVLNGFLAAVVPVSRHQQIIANQRSVVL